MKKLLIILATTSSFILAVTAHSSQHSKNTSINPCGTSSIKQACSKTMTSVFDKKGRLWSIWTNGMHIYVNYSDNNGTSFSQPVVVNKIPEKISARKENRPKIAISNTGRIYLSWTIKLNKRFTGNIRFSKSTNNGNTFDTPRTINDNLEIISHRFDALSVNSKGHIYISWLDKRDQELAKKSGHSYNGAAAYYSVSTDKGTSFSKNKKIIDNSCECCRMAIDIDINDLPVIAWRHIYDDNIRDHSIVSFIDSNTPSKPKRLSNDQWKMKGCPHHGPSLSINNDNRYHSVWFNNAKKRHGIFYAHSDDNGSTFSKPINIGNYEKQASHADVKAMNNNIYIAWKEFDAPFSKVYMMKSIDNGKSWNHEKMIAKTKLNSDYAFLVVKDNKAFISWHIPGKPYKLISLDQH